jgi:hypothetical protein
VAQHFSAAITVLFSPAALAAEVKLCVAKDFVSSLLALSSSEKTP